MTANVEAQTKVYRELHQTNGDLLNWLDLRNQLYTVVDPKGKEHIFVDNDIPRDGEITPVIINETAGFALFDNEGSYVASYSTLDKAIRAQQSAKIVVNTDVEAEDPDEILTDGDA